MGAACQAGEGKDGSGDGTIQEYTYVPVPGPGHKTHVLFTLTISTPSRVTMYMVKMFKLPVDFCYPNLMAGHTQTPEHLKMNPIHTVPCLAIYSGENSDPVGINDSTAVTEYFERKWPSKIPDWFLGGKDPLKRGKIMEAVNAVKDTLFRSTVYQYVYPASFGGMMTECQYDLCKRDFILDIIEKWCAEGTALNGAKPTLADFYLVSTHMTMMWNSHPDFERDWKWEEVLPKKYPNMWAAIQKWMEEPSIKYIHEHNPSAECPGGSLWNESVAAVSGAIAKTKNCKGRYFLYDHPQGMVQQMALASQPHGKEFNKVIT